MNVQSVSLDRLLSDWRWLCPGDYELIDINDFRDLFLIEQSGAVLMLDLQGGELKQIAESVRSFEQDRQSETGRHDWYFEKLSDELRTRGFQLSEGKVFGYKASPLFIESIEREDNIYLADLYEYVSFMGDLHKQLKDLPDGTKVKLTVKREPKSCEKS